MRAKKEHGNLAVSGRPNSKPARDLIRFVNGWLPTRPISAPRRSALAKALGLLQGNFARDQVRPEPAAGQILEIEKHGRTAVLEADLERAAAGFRPAPSEPQ
jgi:hypothetical protein